MESNRDDRILVIGATNRPFDIDSGILRRFHSKICVPLPDQETRFGLIEGSINKHRNDIKSAELNEICILTEGYSGSDIYSVVKHALMAPIRELNEDQLKLVEVDQLRALNLNDFKESIKIIKRSSCDELEKLVEWKNKFAQN